jgi:hypothetical protein
MDTNASMNAPLDSNRDTPDFPRLSFNETYAKIALTMLSVATK